MEDAKYSPVEQQDRGDCIIEVPDVPDKPDTPHYTGESIFVQGRGCIWLYSYYNTPLLSAEGILFEI